MSELIKLAEIEEDAIRTANNKLDADACLKKWPAHVHYAWRNAYYRQIRENEITAQCA